MLEEILNNINSYSLDDEQKRIVLSNSKSLLVVAGAGSGKSLTIIGKIRYLIEIEKISDKDILCISFTNDATNSLKGKIDKYNYNVDTFTFHKLSLEIIGNNYEICSSDYLEYIIDEFFSTIVFNYSKIVKYILKYFKVSINKDYINQYRKFYKDNSFKIFQLEKLLSKFIHLFKSNGYELEKFIYFDKKIILPNKKYFIRIALNIYIIYTNELNSSGKIDYDDMIILATKKVKESGINKKYKYIIIDEYQDTSYIRYSLIKSIIDKTNASFMTVGDDFQSIYRFTGCDLDIFLKFNEFFPNSDLLKIQNTYRNSTELINIAGSFIMKNKCQIKKKLKSFKSMAKPLKIIYCNNKVDALKRLINNIKKNIMILGRNNNDINSYIDDDFIFTNGKLVYKKDTSINIVYLTVHRSKGLECDNVIILNMIDDIMGFPCKIKNSSILKLVTSKKDKYLYEEERRLFYVALTRTKNSVYLMTEKSNESIFIKELLRFYKKNIEIV